MNGNKPVKIICTIGPSSKNADVLKRFEARDIYLNRINLSHVDVEEIEDYIQALKQCNIPVAIDTEGAQVRTGKISGRELALEKGQIVRIHRRKIECDGKNLYFTPLESIQYIRSGDLIEIDFNSVLLQVEDTSESESHITCRVLIGGQLGSNKGVHCDDLDTYLPAFSEKDLKAVALAKKYNIRYFTLSFISRAADVAFFRKIYPEAIVYSKIETLEGIQNLTGILDASDGILIDRGDLSRYIPIERMPLTQKVLINTARQAGKEVFIASNLLDTMASDLKPSRAEASDIVNAVIDGVSGFVLTKETAVGRFPVETINMLRTLIRQGQKGLQCSLQRAPAFTPSLDCSQLKSLEDFGSPDFAGALIPPHGGRLVESYLENHGSVDWAALPTLSLNEQTLMDLEQIGIGTYSPLEGFLCRDDLKSVLNHMRLKSGVPWTLPILLHLTEAERNRIGRKDRIALVSADDGEIYGLLEIDDIYLFDKAEFAVKMFGTDDPNHPGVASLKKQGDYLIGGRIRLRQRKQGLFQIYNLTPRQTRKIFSALGWARIVGFHTRNVIHRSHEYIQMQALERTGCDGLFVHPVIGKKKKGDFSADVIIRSYEIMIEKFYPRNRVILGIFSTYSRYAGPREAVFTALCRQNFGCSHFIVGRDHTGVKDYYPPTASQEIFHQFPDIGIKPVFFDEIGYAPDLDSYVDKNGNESRNLISISGTEIRNMLTSRRPPPPWLMRPEISGLIIERISRGENVFV